MLNTFTIIGDPHITKKTLDKGLQLFQTVESMGNPTIWLGDLLDTKSVIRGECQNLFFEYFESSKLQHIILVGNHDWFNLQCKDHSLKTLRSLKNVTIIDSVREHPNLPFIFFPYIDNKAELKEVLSTFKDRSKIAFGHFDISGFDYGNGKLCEDGMITQKDFSGFKRVISGHFHKLQQSGNLTYLGTPFSHSFGEANQDKVIGVYTLDTDTLELIPTTFPRHVSIKIEVSKRGSQKRLEEFLEENKNNKVRVQLFGSTEEVAKLDRSKFESLGVRWDDKSETSFDSTINVDESLGNKAQFLEWAGKIKMLDSETTKLGLEILESLNAN